ncbi:MAG: hypothetical protein CVU51_11420 [Deltaproteobacteria bacterium HGW-Deltaproteobacteria-1]|jgi:hypothetical protein|nr:MAG: hypothetical protein CVU51_11420 [Deltaproteobacteria bacterium HGW-Deltaproteobacteria-1]
MAKIKWNMVWGIGITLVFLVLLAVRLDFFKDQPVTIPLSQKTEIARQPESWMNIYQNRNKIGFIRRTFHALENGRFQTTENVTMQINTMGITQALHISTETELNSDLAFSSFNFQLNSSLFRFNARGYTNKDKLILYTGLPDAEEKTILPISDVPHISGNIYEAAFRAGLEKDQTSSFSIFDPSTLGIRKISVTRTADEVIPIMGKRVLTQKFCADFMGAKNCAWLAKDGEVLKESGILGLSMEKVSPEQARVGFALDNAVDFTQVASIPSNQKLTDPARLTEITIKISNINHSGLMLNGGRQKFRQDLLTITRELIPAEPAPDTKMPPVFRQFLKPSPLVQSDHPQIKAAVENIVSPGDSPSDKMRKVVAWVYKNIQKKPVLSVPNALEVLKNRTGDCNEHAVLTAALLRSAGVPTQIETGLVYLNGRFYYHAWNLAYVGQWVTADAVFNQIPADVTHIRLVRGEGSQQLDLLGVMGKIKLEVISTR